MKRALGGDCPKKDDCSGENITCDAEKLEIVVIEEEGSQSASQPVSQSAS